ALTGGPGAVRAGARRAPRARGARRGGRCAAHGRDLSYLLFTTLFLAALALAVRPFLVRRAAAWPAETPDAHDDVARAVSGLRDLEFARAAGTIAAEDHDRLRTMLERGAFARPRTLTSTAAPWRTVAIAAILAG